MNYTRSILPLLLLQLGWREIVIVTDNEQEDSTSTLTQTLNDEGVQHVIVRGSEALSGEWVHGVVRTGVDSWRPLHFLLLCSLTCVSAALGVASQIEQTLGTQSAFGMTSRWLLVTTGSDHLIDQLQVSNVTMDNVAVLDIGVEAKKQASLPSAKEEYCQNPHRSHFKIQWLQWKVNSRSWTGIQKRNQTSGTEEGLLFPNIHRGFNGRRIRVLVKEWQVYVTLHLDENGTRVWSGLLMDYLNAASRALNFTYELVDATDDEWGSGTPDDLDRGFMGYVFRKEVDIGLSNYDTTWERSQLFDFMWPVFYTAIIMVYRKPEVTDSFRIPLFGPLSSAVLLAVVGAMLVISLLLWCLEMVSSDRSVSWWDRGEHRSGVARLKSTTMLVTLDKVFQITGAAILTEPSERRVNSRGGRVLLWSWWMVSLVVAAAYSGTLTAFLSVSKQPPPFSSPQDLLTTDHHYTWGTFLDSVQMFILKDSPNPVYQGLWAGIQRFRATDPMVLSDNATAIAQKVRSEDFVLFLPRLTAMSMFREDCNIIFKEAGMKQNLMMGPILPKGSILVEPLSDLVLRLRADGQLSKWTDKWFPRAVCPPTPSGPKVIALPHVEGVLLVLPVGTGLALLTLALEVVYRRRHAVS